MQSSKPSAEPPAASACQLYICLSPALLPLFDLTQAVVVVVDIFRATTSICAALSNGVADIRPVESVEACRALQERGFLAAGERNGRRVDGFEYGNSPRALLGEELRGSRLALTTTNGTQALFAARRQNAVAVVAGAFVNLGVLADWLQRVARPVVVVCAGWKGHANLEDSCFAGTLARGLAPRFQLADDAGLMVSALEQAIADRPEWYWSRASHPDRLRKLGLEADIDYCLQTDTHPVVPILTPEGRLVDALTHPETFPPDPEPIAAGPQKVRE